MGVDSVLAMVEPYAPLLVVQLALVVALQLVDWVVSRMVESAHVGGDR